MDGLPVRQQDDPEVAAFHFVNSRSAPDSTVGLDVLPLLGSDDALNPFVLDYRTVGTRANCFKILCGFHGAKYLEPLTKSAARASPDRCEASVSKDEGSGFRDGVRERPYRFASSAIFPLNTARSFAHSALSGESFVKRDMIA
jgi:hypothetical protein